MEVDENLGCLLRTCWRKSWQLLIWCSLFGRISKHQIRFINKHSVWTLRRLRCFPTKVLRCFPTKVLRCFPTSDEVTRISTTAHFGAWVCVSVRVVSKLHCGTFSWHEFEPSFLWNFVMAAKTSARRNSPMVQFDRVSAQSPYWLKMQAETWAMKRALRSSNNGDFKIGWLRTTTTVKHATAHDQNHLTAYFSRVVLRLQWVVELFRVV